MNDEAQSTSDVYYLICPHCGYKDQNTGEIFDEIEQEIDDYECSSCGKTFIAVKIAIFYYEGIIHD